MRRNSDIHYGAFTYYLVKDEGRRVVHKCLSLIEKKGFVNHSYEGEESKLGQKLII